jgi:hypothetical protein
VIETPEEFRDVEVVLMMMGGNEVLVVGIRTGPSVLLTVEELRPPRFARVVDGVARVELAWGPCTPNNPRAPPIEPRDDAELSDVVFAVAAPAGLEVCASKPKDPAVDARLVTARSARREECRGGV